MRKRLPAAVSIATSDSGGGAGIQADLLTFAAHGVYGATVLAAGTAQNTRAVTGIETFSVPFLAKQIDAVFSDLRPSAVKIGMLFDAPRVRAAVLEAAASRCISFRLCVSDPTSFRRISFSLPWPVTPTCRCGSPCASWAGSDGRPRIW